MIASHAAPGAQPFDGVAATYDEWFEQSAITRSIRGVVHKSCTKYFRSGERVLELNCGTGTDAHFLTGAGIRVTATDASPAMIELASTKLAGEIASGQAETRVMAFDEIESLAEEPFDGVLSNFGGMNCAREPETLIRELSRRVRPGGVFISCLMNRHCAWEMMSFLLRGNLREAGRRNRDTQVNIGHTSVSVTYYSPRSYSQLLSPYFAVEEIYGLNILSPGPNSRNFAAAFPGTTKFLLAADGLVRGVRPFSGLGDHFIVIARRPG